MVLSDEHDGDLEFERALLRSARRDAPAPEATDRAWARFATMAAVVAAQTSGAFAGASAAGAGSRGLLRGKWLVLGALGGAALTLAALGVTTGAGKLESHAFPREIRLVTVDRIVTVPSVASANATVTAPSIAPTIEIAPPPALVSAQQPTSSPSPATPTAPPATTSDSSLAAEIAALDAARVLLTDGSPAEALHAIARYHDDFPRGALSPEADVLALDALAAQGDRDRLATESARFLTRYPDAPQCAHVRKLIAASTSP